MRWLQLAAHSAILRMHDRGGSAGGCTPWPWSDSACWTVRPWNVPLDFYGPAMHALRTRAALLPYLYTQARAAFDTGVGLTRPMYYYFPAEGGAYPESMDAGLGQLPGSRQYFLGDALLVAPVTVGGACVTGSGNAANPAAATKAVAASTPPDAPCGLAMMDVWLPPGLWFELHSGRLLKGASAGGTARSLGVHIDDVPIYAKGGAVVPRRPLVAGSTVGLAAHAYDALEWSIYPGAPSGKGRVYEDDGETYAYLHGAFATTELAYAWLDGHTLHVQLTTQVSGDGSFAKQLPAERRHTLRLPNALPPTAVVAQGAPAQAHPPGQGALPPTALRWRRSKGGSKGRLGGEERGARAHHGAEEAGSWSYDGSELAVVISLPPIHPTQSLNVTVTFAPAAAPSMVQTLDGLRGKIAAARRAKAVLNQRRMAPGEHSSHMDPHGAPLARVASASDRLSLHATTAAFASDLGNVSTLYDAAHAEIDALAATLHADVDRLRAAYAVQILAHAP